MQSPRPCLMPRMPFSMARLSASINADIRSSRIYCSGEVSRASLRLICCGMRGRISGGMRSWVSPPFPLRYTDHIEGAGVALFERVCKLDLEGIVAKNRHAPYVTEGEQS